MTVFSGPSGCHYQIFGICYELFFQLPVPKDSHSKRKRFDVKQIIIINLISIRFRVDCFPKDAFIFFCKYFKLSSFQYVSNIRPHTFENRGRSFSVTFTFHSNPPLSAALERLEEPVYAVLNPEFL